MILSRFFKPTLLTLFVVSAVCMGGAQAEAAVTLTASATTVQYGTPVTLSWTTSGVTPIYSLLGYAPINGGCAMSGPFLNTSTPYLYPHEFPSGYTGGGSSPLLFGQMLLPSGSVQTSPLTLDTTFSVMCTDGSSSSVTVKVTGASNKGVRWNQPAGPAACYTNNDPQVPSSSVGCYQNGSYEAIVNKETYAPGEVGTVFAQSYGNSGDARSVVVSLNGATIANCTASYGCQTGWRSFTAPATPGAYTVSTYGDYNNPTLNARSSFTINVACPAGTTWNGSSCVSATPTCTSAGPANNPTVPYNQASYVVSANGVQNANDVQFAVWSNVNGQDDLRWYSGANQIGTWRATFPFSNHPDTGQFSVDAYMNNKTVFCGNANFIRAAGAVTVTASASPNPVPYNTNTTVTWSSTNATSCTMANVGSVNLSGSMTVGPILAMADRSVTCTNGTSSQTASVIINPAVPVVTFTASPTSIANGGSSTLSWSATGATSCTAGGAWSGSKNAVSGSESTGALTASKTYTLYCTNTAGNSTTKSVTVTVAAATTPSCTITPSATTVSSGQSVTLNWSVSGFPYTYPNGVTARFISDFGANTSGSGPYSGSVTVTPTNQSTTYTGTIDDTWGWLSSQPVYTCSATVTVQSPPPPSSSPDLTAGSVTPITATAGTPVIFSAIVSNASAASGGASTGASFSNFFQVATAANGGGTITDLTSTSMTALAAGASGSVTKSYTFTTAGTYSIRACADKTSSAGGGVITEANAQGTGETNNCGPWTAITVSSATPPPPSSLPDLTTGSVTPTTATPNTAVMFSATVSNIGSASTGAGFTDLFEISSTSAPASFAVIEYRLATSSVALGASGSNLAKMNYMLTAGTWYIRVCADTNNINVGVITESNEGNNCGTWTTVTVAATPPPPTNPSITSFVATPASIVPGQSAKLTWSSTNATSCTGTGFNTANATSNATGVSVSPSVTSSYQITCTGAAGTTPATRTVTVTVQQPSVTINANPLRVPINTASTISWSSTFATSCAVNKGSAAWKTGTSNVGISDTIVGQTIYTITCQTTGSPISSSVTVNVVPVVCEFGTCF